MNHSNDEIQKFFNGMRQSDEGLQIVEFEECFPEKQRQTPTIYIKLVGMAASLLMLLGVFYFSIDDSVEQVNEPAVVITISTEDNRATEMLMDELSTMDSWSAPTNSLINDFND